MLRRRFERDRNRHVNSVEKPEILILIEDGYILSGIIAEEVGLPKIENVMDLYKTKKAMKD